MGNPRSTPVTFILIFTCLFLCYFSAGARYTHLTVALHIPHNITSLIFLQSVSDGEFSNSLRLIAPLAITMVTITIDATMVTILIDAHNYIETEKEQQNQ